MQDKKKAGLAVLAVILGAMAVVVASILCFMPTKGPFAAEELSAIKQAGTEIDAATAPIWRLCSLPKVGRKTAEEIRKNQEKP